MSARIVLLLLAAVALSACKSQRVPAPEPMASVSEDEARALAGPLSEALVSCNAGALAGLFDTEWLFRTVARGADLGAKDERTLYEALKSRELFAKEFLCRPGAELGYAGIRPGSGMQRLIFHQADPERPGVLEVLVGKNSEGAVLAIGLFDYREGWPLRRKLATGRALKREVKVLERANAALSQAPKDVAAVASEYKESSRIQTIAVRAAAHLGPEDYRRALAAYVGAFPDDLSIYLNVVDDLARAGHHLLVDEAVVALGQGLGDNVGLLSYRVALLADAEAYAQATKLAEEALLAHPEQQEAHYRLLEVHVLARNFAGAVAVMRLLGERFNVRFTEESMDTSHPAYVELLASDAWSAY